MGESKEDAASLEIDGVRLRKLSVAAAGTRRLHLRRRRLWNRISSLVSLHRPIIMTTGRTCAFPGCSKPPYPSSPGCDQVCCTLHRQPLMAGRFRPDLPNPYSYMVDRNARGLCALSSCTEPPLLGDSWCSRTHCCEWLSDFTSTLQPEQFCKLDGCDRHVFVREDSSRWEFCGWRHRQKYVMRSAMRRRPDLGPRQQASLRSQSTLSNEVECDHSLSVESLVDSLRMYAKGRKVPKGIKEDDDFFNKHPWEVCADGQKCVLIVRLKHTAQGKRVLLTKKGYHWKQQGRPIRKSNHTVKYFCYQKLKGNEANRDDEFTYHMEEYSVEGVQDYAVIKLARKARPSVTINSECLASKDSDVCSPNNMIQQSNEVSACSFNFDELPVDYYPPSALDVWLEELISLG